MVSIQVWVKNGSADETKGIEGISHFIEHLVFKGTESFGVGEVARTIEGAGGELNAYTTFDYTVFHVTMSKEDSKTGLHALYEMVAKPKFDAEEVDKEREVVIEEIKRSLDNPYQVSSQKLFSTVFQKHPYGIPIIGFDKNIRKVNVKTLRTFHQKRYSTDNMTVVVVGDFNRKEIDRQITQTFGTLSASRVTAAKRKTEPKQSKPRILYELTKFKEASINFAFRAPSISSQDVATLDVMCMIIGQGDSSRLVRRLRLEAPLVNSVGAGQYNPKDPGLLSVTCHLNVENISKVAETVAQELSAICRGDILAQEIERAKLNIEADEVFSLETVDGLARKVGFSQLMTRSPDYIEKYLDLLRKVDVKSVTKVARKYLDPKLSTICLCIHKEDAGVYTKKKFADDCRQLTTALKTAIKAKVSPSQKVKSEKHLHIALKTSGRTHPIVKHRLSNGGLLILKKNPEIPIIHGKIGFLGGLRKETSANLGVTTLLSNVWTSGTQGYSEREIAEVIEGCAGSISAFGGRNSIGINIEMLKTHQKEAWDIFEKVVTEPTFPSEAVAREASLQIEAIKTRHDHPSSVATQLFLEAMFQSHPYARDVMGKELSVSRIDRDTVKDHYRGTALSGNAVAVVTGDFDQNKVIDRFERLTSSLEKGPKYLEVFPLGSLTEDQTVFEKSEKEQSHIIIGVRGLTFSDPDRYCLTVLQGILAGQGGRLFLELRDKASLAYTVSPVSMLGVETGYFGVYIGCSPDNGKKAVSMINEELEKIARTSPTEEEVERAKRYLIGRNHIDLQRNGSQASAILFDELYGIDCEEAFRFSEHLKPIKAHHVRDLAHRLFSQKRVSVAVGPEAPW
ncbi:MAG: insulinase family protein [Oligoflexia bacterium]|nr:insulinase family protein [Oligoflexia bacterium]